MIPLSQKIEQLKVRYQGEASLPPSDTLTLIYALRMLIEEQELRVTALAEAQIRLDGRIHLLERLASMYNPDARGK